MVGTHPAESAGKTSLQDVEQQLNELGDGQVPDQARMVDGVQAADGTASDDVSSNTSAGDASEGVTAPVRARRPRRFVSYQSALKYLNDRVNYERIRPGKVEREAFKLDRMRALMSELGDPQTSPRWIVHVAGSKGKGSIVEMVASCLGAKGCGYTVGVYTSPHLVDVRERVRLGDAWIEESDFVTNLGHVAAAATRIDSEHGESTYFEIITALALRYFAEQAVDVAVLEVGLGGRLDATNVVVPTVAAIGAIQLEHTQILGNTVEEIAREKAGILKPGVVGVTFKQDKGIMTTFSDVAQEVGAELRVLGKDIEFSSRFEASPELGPHARVCVSSKRLTYEHLPVPLKGEHQAVNCGIALAILDELHAHGLETPERQVALGLEKTLQRGRLEQVWDRPRILIDGAHTPESVEATIKALGAHERFDSMVVVFGCAADKNIDAMLEKVAIGADKLILTKSSENPRAAKPEELLKRLEQLSTSGPRMAQIEPTVKEAINTAVRAVGRDDLILVTGSFYLAGEAKRLLLEARQKRVAQQIEAKK